MGFTCRTLWAWACLYYSGRKPYVLYVVHLVGVEPTIPVQEVVFFYTPHGGVSLYPHYFETPNPMKDMRSNGEDTPITYGQCIWLKYPYETVGAWTPTMYSMHISRRHAPWRINMKSASAQKWMNVKSIKINGDKTLLLTFVELSV